MQNIDTNQAFDLFFKNSNNLLLIVDSNCQIISINPVCIDFFGYTPDELIGHHIMDLVHTDDTERATQQIKKLFDNEGETLSFKNKALHKDGSTKLLKWATCVRNSVMYAMGFDITYQEEKLRTLQNQRRQYLEGVNSQLGLWELDIDSHDFYGDERTYEIFGLPFRTKQNIRELAFILTEEYQQLIVAQIKKSLTSKLFENFECEITCQSTQQVRLIAVSGSFIFDENFNIKSFFGTIQDVTEQKKMAQKLAELDKLQSTMLAALETLVALYADNKIQWANKKEMLGYTIDYMKDKPISIIFKNYDDYCRIKADAYQEMLVGKTYSTEFEAVSRTGEPAWIRLSGKLLTPQSVIWTAVDVTEQKTSELIISKNHTLLKDSQRAAHIGSWEIINNNNDILWNKEACRILDIQAETLSEPLSEIFKYLDNESSEEIKKYLMRVSENQAYIDMECSFTSRGGNGKHVHLIGNRLESENGTSHIVGIIQDVTYQHQLEWELQDKRKKMEAISMASPTAIGVVQKYDLIDCNNAFYNITGYSETELANEGLKKLMPTDELRKLEELSFNYSINSTFAFKTIWTHKNGQKIDVLLNFSVLQSNKKYLGCVITATYISELTRIQSVNSQLIEATNQSYSEYIIFDSNWNINYVNKRVYEIHKYKPTDIIGHNITEIENESYLLNQLSSQLEAEGRAKGEFQDKKDGITYWLLVKLFTIYNSTGKIIGYVMMKDNITQRKKIEFELKNALAKAEESDKMKESLLQKLSHEIRTPLNAIVGFSDVLSTATNLTPATIKSYTNIISDNSSQLLNIITDMLTMSDIDAGQVSINIENINIDIELERLYSKFRAKAESKNINLVYYRPDAVGFTIATDKIKFINIMSNLIDNAIKFTAKGKVSFGYNINGSYIEFFVEDTGIGISPENQAHLFDRFFQVGDAVGITGIGIGLTISKAFSQMLNGYLHFNSTENQGSTFYLTLPICLK